MLGERPAKPLAIPFLLFIWRYAFDTDRRINDNPQIARTREPQMNINKALEVAAEYRAEGNKLLALADEIEAAAKKAENGTGTRAFRKAKHPKRFTRKKGKSTGYLAVAMDVLREEGHAMHVTDLLPKISEKMGKVVTRPNVEGALVRGVAQGKLKRTRPSTYALT